MNKSSLKFKDVDDYISHCPEDVQMLLNQIRTIIKTAAPHARERISYGMPFYEYGGSGLKGRFIYFAAFKKHISLFIPPSNTAGVPRELQPYHTSKATYQFPLNKPFPIGILKKTIVANVKERDLQNKHKTIKSDALNEITAYNNKQSATDKAICVCLLKEISKHLQNAEHKIWHGHPVWFINGNPVVGYSKQKKGIRLMFWSGAGFNENKLTPGTGKFKDASVFYTKREEINITDLKRWLNKSVHIQWDYKNIVKRKGKLVKLKIQ